MSEKWTGGGRARRGVFRGSALSRALFTAYSFLTLLFFAPAMALGSAPIAEITPVAVTLGGGPTSFVYDIRGDDSSPADRIVLSVPGCFTGAALVSVKVNGASATFTNQSVRNQIALLLDAPAPAGAAIQVVFQASAPTGAPGIFDFPSSLDFTGDPAPPAASIAGNADGDPSDGNSRAVTADLSMDGSFGDWNGVARFLDANDDATPEKGDLRSGWFAIDALRTRIFARLDVDACLMSGQTTAFDILMDTTSDGLYDFRVELEIRGDGTVLQKHLYHNYPADSNQGNDQEVPFSGAAFTGQVPDDGCNQATEWSIPLADLGNPSTIELAHFESHPSGPSTAVADTFPDFGFIRGSVLTGSFSRVGPIINEVFLGSPGVPQWVEIANSSILPFSLAGMTLTDKDGSGNSNILLPSITLPGGAFLVVHLAAGTNDFDFSDGSGHFYTGSSTPVFEREDQLALYGSSLQNPGTLEDFVAWDADATRSADFGADAADAVAAGLWVASAALDISSMDPAQSLGRSGESISRGIPADWEISSGRDAADPTPGWSNVGGVVINEVLFSPGLGVPQGVELYNAGNGVVDLTGWTVSDGDAGGPGAGVHFVVPQLSSADRILPGQARAWIAFGTGVDSASTVFASGVDPSALGAADQASLFFRDEPLASRLTDFVSWDASSSHDADWLADDDLAQAAGIWNKGVSDDFVDVISLQAGHSILRTTDGVDTNRSQDWSFSLGISEGDRDGEQDGRVDS